MIPAVAKSQVGRGSVAAGAPGSQSRRDSEGAPRRRQGGECAEAVAGFDAQCAAEDAPEPTNPSLSYLAGRYGVQVLFFIGLLALVIWAWPVIVMLAKGAVLILCLLPFWLISGLTTPRRRYYHRLW